MKRKIIAISLVAIAFSGCATTNTPQPKPKVVVKKTENKHLKKIEEFVKGTKEINKTKKIALYNNKPVDTKEVKEILLKNNALFAKKHKKEALKEKIRLKSNAPLYIPPRFAKMIVFPYVSDDGIYHDTQVVWVKVKDGEFVLNQGNSKEKARVFSIHNKDY